MARSQNSAEGNRLRIQAEVLDVRKDDQVPDLIVYAFTQSGRLLGRTELKDGKAEIETRSTKEPERVRVLIGPKIEADDEGNVLSTLVRLGAPERLIHPERIAEVLRLPIDRFLWTCWARFCIIRGTLLKRTLTGGLYVDLPVCDAEVEIYEVDPVLVIFPKIPDYILERIRDRIRKPWPPPPPERFRYGIKFPPIPPGPGPDPAPLIGVASSKRQISAIAATPQPTEPSYFRDEIRTIMMDMGYGEPGKADAGQVEESNDASQKQNKLFNFTTGEATEVEPEEAIASLKALSETPNIKSAADVSLSAFKASLLARRDLIRPLLCWLWPPAVTMQLVATANTDDCGHFRARFYRGCSSDTPDLYFKAYRRIGFLRFPIYAPLPIACYTWWNYACGSEVTLITTSPFALTCPPCKPVIAPPHWVLAMAVGNTSLASIRGTSSALQPTTSGSNIGLTSWGAPFGGYIRLRFEFDNTLRADLNVKYYRVRWRKIGTFNSFVDLTEDAWRHYAHTVGSTLMLEPYKLGPQPVGGTPNLYEIPPALPPLGQWSIPDAVVDTTSASFRSTAFAPAGAEGDYQFELTLFDSNGVEVNATTVGINYVLPTTLDLTATIPTENASLLGLVTAAGRLVFRLHVDNNLCVAAVQPPSIAGSVSADPCGLLRYSPGDSVTLQWTASHPHQFATFQHSVVKGATELPAPITTSGIVTASPGTHVESNPVSALLGTCSVAGFAETVSVWAMATDGWSRQSQYDDNVIQAFALALQGA